jgi:hypothetical protein
MGGEGVVREKRMWDAGETKHRGAAVEEVRKPRHVIHR